MLFLLMFRNVRCRCCLFVRFDRLIDRSVVIFLPPPILASTNTFNCWILYSNVSVLIQVCVCR